MKFYKRFIVLFIIINSLTLLSAKQDNISTAKGINLSNEVYKFLKTEDFLPKTQSLINNGENTFPYNVYIDFNSISAVEKNLLLVFSQDQTITNKELIKNALNYIKNEKFNFNLTVLFSYDERHDLKKQIAINGYDVFINSINVNDNYTAIIFDLNNENNKVITSSHGLIAPSWLIQNEFNLYLKENLKSNLPLYYVSQIYKLNFFEDKELESFLLNNIPSIKLCFNSLNCENGKAFNIIKDSIFTYSNSLNNQWEHHFLLFQFFGKFINISEAIIIRIIILLIFVLLIFVFILGLLNIRVKNNAMFKLKQIWYSIPLTLFLTYISFISGRNLFRLIYGRFSAINSIYYCLGIQTGLALLLITLFYITILMLNYSISEKSIDFLLVLSCFINQAIFILIDISLFPIFSIIFILSVIAYYIKNNGIHILIFILMIITLVPYGNTLITKGNPYSIQHYLLNNTLTPVMLSVVIYPVFMVYLRILTSCRNNFKKIKSFIIFTISSYFVLILALFVFFSIYGRYMRNTFALPKEYKIIESLDEKISFKYTDKTIFTDIIRTIEIDLDEEPEICDVRINSATSTPVLYSDNDYEAITQNSVIFKIPENPPNHLIFNYGATNEPCNIVISAIYAENENKNIYKLVTKIVSIGDL